MSLPRISVNNPVFANLLMLGILVSGLASVHKLTREFFPNIDPDRVTIMTRYRGATPLEIEKSVTVKIEEAIQAVDGIEEYQSTISEGLTVTLVEVEEGGDAVKVRRDIESEIQKIDDLPEELEKIDIAERRPQLPVMSIVAYGDIGEDRLREAIKTVKDELTLSPEVSEIRISGARDPEISISIHPDRLEKYGLTFGEVARRVAAFNQDIPGGQLKTSGGNIRVRTLGESDQVQEFEKIPIRSAVTGGTVLLGELATIVDGFEEVDMWGRFDGKRAIAAVISKTANQDALKISEIVNDYIEKFNARTDRGFKLAVVRDWSRHIRGRIELMTRNAFFGLALVFVSLGLFLDLRVAFWAAVGLPVAFMGTFLLMWLFGYTVNVVTLFGLMVVLGMLVDDAIIIGENIYRLREEEGLPAREAAIRGAEEMTMPILAAILTTMAAFLPLVWMEGAGRFTFVIPFIVIAALSVSLVEAFAILPSHLAEFMGPPPAERERRAQASLLRRAIHRVGRFRQWLLGEFPVRLYERVLRFCLHWRYVLSAGFVALAFYAIALPMSGKLKYVFFEKTDSDQVYINLEMPSGSTAQQTEKVLERIEKVARETPEYRSAFTVLGSQILRRGRQSTADPATIGQVRVNLAPAEERNKLVDDVIADMRKRLGSPAGVKSIRFSGSRRGPSGDSIEVRVIGENMDSLTRAVARVKEELAGFNGVKDIDDDLKMGKVEARIRLLPSAANLGLTVGDLASQLRASVFGVKAQSLQRGTEEIEVWARLDKESRKSLSDIENLRIATPNGGRVPFGEVAELTTGRGLATLARINGKRTITVSATVDQDVGNTLDITESLIARLEDLPLEIPGVQLYYAGTYEDQKDSLSDIFFDFGAAVLLIYTIIAVLFKSYIKPLIIMTAIPFSLIGAVLGHYWTGWNLGLLSSIGMVALAGIVVNDSIVLVDLLNRKLDEGRSVIDAVVEAGKGRLRAIFLTSVTTIVGLGPLMLERSVQARFLIPMATSIVWGLAFSTLLTLFLLPCLYLIHEDVRSFAAWCWTGRWPSLLEPRVNPRRAT